MVGQTPLKARVLQYLIGGGEVDVTSMSWELGVPASILEDILREFSEAGILNTLRGGFEEVSEWLTRRGVRLGRVIRYLTSCRSTQDVLKDLAESGEGEGTVVICESMSGGRGRLGRYWHAPEGGLWFSVLLKPKFREVQLISLAAGLAVAEGLEAVTGVETLLKWPNDVLLGGRKLAGILSEGSYVGSKLSYVILGIGINVNNELSSELRGVATTLRDYLGFEVPRPPILASILASLWSKYIKLSEGLVSEVLEEWVGRSATIGREVRVVTHGGEVEGVATGLAEDGSLIVINDLGREIKVSHGEVIHLR